MADHEATKLLIKEHLKAAQELVPDLEQDQSVERLRQTLYVVHDMVEDLD